MAKLGKQAKNKQLFVKGALANKAKAAKEAAAYKEWIARGRNPASFRATNLARLIFEGKAVAPPHGCDNPIEAVVGGSFTLLADDYVYDAMDLAHPYEF